ncbi:hypothetical protein AB4Y32_05585 [Paraburkholderia phymatum]|uniref:Uncharacterized protein n=1 Tax=Paraburkholderia phymatum TaxID=148447 RepID=A0ACC6TV82_9BURK
MQRWIARLISQHAPTPEKLAGRSLSELRMCLFQAEQRILDAQSHADYYRRRIAFCEEVARIGIEKVSDQRNRQQEGAIRPNLKLTASQ